ncbi:hypothetical protein [Lysinibacillus capsici]|uniref:hypothetical protein n=1 Tax=Lysinibacillus capsici TaxID=2115968 RepID=UPI002480355C|nr:hypothetical protein [Lysinibacillus capsici]
MNVVTIIGVSVLGLVTVLSAFHGMKAYRGYKIRKSENYSEEAILEELENEDVLVRESSFSEVLNSMSSKSSREVNSQKSLSAQEIASTTFKKGNLENKEVKYPNSQSSLRSAAIAFNKREHDRERDRSSDEWNPNATHSFTSSSNMGNNNSSDKSSIFDTGDSGFRSNLSSTDESIFSSSSKDFSGNSN